MDEITSILAALAEADPGFVVVGGVGRYRDSVATIQGSSNANWDLRAIDETELTLTNGYGKSVEILNMSAEVAAAVIIAVVNGGAK